MKKQKILNLIGLATRARKIISGEEMVLKKIEKVNIVFLGSDAGPNTTKKITNKCNHYQKKLINCFTKAELTKAIGKDNRVVLAIVDRGFCQAINKLLEEAI